MQAKSGHARFRYFGPRRRALAHWQPESRQRGELARIHRRVVCGPLGAVPLAPDVVLFVRANQTLIRSEVSQQTEGGLPPAMGRPACAVAPQARNTGRLALRTMWRCTRCPGCDRAATVRERWL
jgi:hypothetical protein